MTTADDYINRVVDQMPRATPLRSQIATELRGHITERVGNGHALEDVLRQLGDPAALAESYLAAVPLNTVSFSRRAAAKIVDILIVLTPIVALLGLAWRSGLSEVLGAAMILAAMGGAVLFGIYTAIAERLTGQTVGKRVLGIRVVRESGARISVGQAVIRQLPMFLQIYWIDVLFALATDKAQRAFEMLSKTRAWYAWSVRRSDDSGANVRDGVEPRDTAPHSISRHRAAAWEARRYRRPQGSCPVQRRRGANGRLGGWRKRLCHRLGASAARDCENQSRLFIRPPWLWMERGRKSETPARVVADLHAMLVAVGEKPPFVLVGASMGGIYVRMYHLQYPDDVAAMVLVDPSHEDDLFTMFAGKGVTIGSLTAEEIRSTIPPGPAKLPRRLAQTGPPFDRLPPDLYRRRVALETRLIDSMPESVPHETVLEVVEGQRSAFSTLQKLGASQKDALGDRPLVVLTRGVRSRPEFRELHARLARSSTNSRHTVVEGAGHEIHLFAPGAVILAIQDVTGALKNKTRLPQR